MPVKIITHAPQPVPGTHDLVGLTDGQLGFITAMLGRVTRGGCPIMGELGWSDLRDTCDKHGISRDLNDYADTVPQCYHFGLGL